MSTTPDVNTSVPSKESAVNLLSRLCMFLLFFVGSVNSLAVQILNVIPGRLFFKSTPVGFVLTSSRRSHAPFTQH
jgi:hypothetical protein